MCDEDRCGTDPAKPVQIRCSGQQQMELLAEPSSFGRTVLLGPSSGSGGTLDVTAGSL